MARVLDQWEILKEHFKEADNTDKCYKAKMLYKMYCDVHNQLYFIFLKPILSEAQHINKLFQSNTADRTKLLNDLVLFIGGLARKVVTPDCMANLLEVNIKNYLHPRPYHGYEFEKKCRLLKMRPDVENIIRGTIINFIINLVTELQKRLPYNLSILQNTSLLSPAKCLNMTKDSIASLAKLMNFESHNISKIKSQWTKINLVQWKSTTSTESLWAEICDYTDSSGINPFNELCKLAKCLLVLPWSNAEIERCFSQMNLVKNKQRNKLLSSTTNAI